MNKILCIISFDTYVLQDLAKNTYNKKNVFLKPRTKPMLV